MIDLFDTCSRLAQIYGPSGREQEVRAALTELAQPYVDEIYSDAMGNLIAHKKGSGKRVMVAAHMDSIGVVATYIDELGMIRFSYVGGLMLGDIVGIRVRFANGTRGVIGYEEKTPFQKLGMEHLFVDIGATSREQAEQLVRPGDFAVFDAPTFRQGDVICSPYLDNRLGCAVVLGAMSALEQTENDLYFVFTAQEEVGLRGATTAAFAVAPDYAIAVDVTDTGDLPERAQPMAVTMGKGPAVKIMDRSVICDEAVKNALYAAGNTLNIPVQREIMVLGGTDTGVIQRSRGGVQSGAVSVPTRYVHTPNEMASLTDAEQAAQLISYAIAREF